MSGYLALVLHAHLPYVRHPEHERFLEESWLFEAILEVYLPLFRVISGWERDALPAHIALTLTPTLCEMLSDSLLRARFLRHLDDLLELAEKETHRTLFTPGFQRTALFYQERLRSLRDLHLSLGQDLVGAFRRLQDNGRIEILASAATHAVLPLLRHEPSVRAQLKLGVESYRRHFGRKPVGIWLPECAYDRGLESMLAEAGLHWFITDTHGLLHARPRPRFGIFAPIMTPDGPAAFGRDHDSARQVWSRHEGYPGDPRYRDFYRDIGFDLDWEYLKPHLAAAGQRGFTGIKYYRVAGAGLADKEPYDRAAALQAAEGHAAHFLDTRVAQLQRAAELIGRPPIVVAPYDAELFGHWWYEGPEFLDCFVRKACTRTQDLALMTPSEFLVRHPAHQLALPGASSWGEGGYWRMWLSHENEWIYRHLEIAQARMADQARSFTAPDPLQMRALRQAGRELVLAQASDWPFILRAGTSPEYARKRIESHLLCFNALHEQLAGGSIDEAQLAALEWKDNPFPELDYRSWA